MQPTRGLAQGKSTERARPKERTRCLTEPSNVEALARSIPEGTENAERKKEALTLGRELLRGTKYEEGL